MKGKILIITLSILILISGVFIWANLSDHSTVGSDSRGYVTKDVYSHYSQSNKKIAVITGMHPREDLSTKILPYVIKLYAVTHNVEIVNYQVTVTENPQDFTEGRSNGEGLVAQYLISDIAKSNYNLVIICHDHEQGYGEGYYIATPTMDSKSITRAEAVHKILTDFNYYQRSTSEPAKSTSITKVDTPITAGGTPVFVYEMPEWAGDYEAFLKSYNLIDTSFRVL
jgi:hypothetical protein